MKIRAENYKKAVLSASKKLKLPPDKITINVLQESKKGVLGLFKKPCIIEVSPKKTDFKDKIKTMVDSLTEVTDENGYFKIDYKDDYAYLTVFPPRGGGKKVDVKDVKNRLELFKIDGVEDSKLQKIVNEALSSPQMIGPWPEGKILDSWVDISATPDGMKAYLYIHSPRKGGRPITYNEIADLLKEKNILYGVNEELLKDIVEKKLYDKHHIIGLGKPPRNGRDAYLNFKFKTSSKITFQEDEKGKVDFKALDLIQNVKEGDLIIEKIPLTKGEKGRDVFGKELNAKDGKDNEIKAGDNVRIDGEGLRAYGTIDGQVVYERGVVRILPLYTVDKDIDYETGNIDFNGTVLIYGRVKEGFSVKATGDIIIAKNIEKGIVESEGNITVKGGVMGKENSIVKCAGNFSARFAENANIISGGDILLSELIMHSNVKCGGNIYIYGRRAALIGGEAVCGGNLKCKELGAVGETRTYVSAGVNPEILKEVAKILKQKLELIKKLNKVEQTVNYINRLKDENKTENNEVEITKLKKAAEFLNSQIKVLEAEEEKINLYKGANANVKVSVKERAYKGVIIELGGFKLFLKNDFSYTTFKIDESRIKAFPYEDFEIDTDKER